MRVWGGLSFVIFRVASPTIQPSQDMLMRANWTELVAFSLSGEASVHDLFYVFSLSSEQQQLSS
jgi:hypothetical protein